MPCAVTQQQFQMGFEAQNGRRKNSIHTARYAEIRLLEQACDSFWNTEAMCRQVSNI